MAADFDQGAMIDHADAVGLHRGREPVGDNHRGSTLKQGIEGPFDAGF